MIDELERMNGECFGEFGKYSECTSCPFKRQCKRFTESEKTQSIRITGKYKARGKEKKKDRY